MFSRETKNRIENKPVLLIGGSPIIGKSVSAYNLARRTGYNCICTDDIGAIVQTVTKCDPLDGLDYHDYYTRASKRKLVDDLRQQHAAVIGPINSLIQRHSATGNPIILEGYALYPKEITPWPEELVGRIWLVADKNLLKNRLLSDKAFYRNAADKRKFIENYLFRSLWHNRAIYDQCKFFSEPFIMVHEDDDIRYVDQQIEESLLK